MLRTQRQAVKHAEHLAYERRHKIVPHGAMVNQPIRETWIQQMNVHINSLCITLSFLNVRTAVVMLLEPEQE